MAGEDRLGRAQITPGLSRKIGYYSYRSSTGFNYRWG